MKYLRLTLRNGTNRRALTTYLVTSAIGHVIWEFAHMPLYVIWQTGTILEIMYNGIHCAIGDVMIASFALLAGLLIGGAGHWLENRRWLVSFITVAAGLAYTVFSEWWNTSIRMAWTYSEFMPVLPVTGTGVTPIAQWVVIPSLALALSCSRIAVLPLSRRT